MIYESPDRGGTVYSRKEGKIERKLIQPSLERERLDRIAKWINILEVSENNASLADAINQVEIIYELSKDEENHE